MNKLPLFAHPQKLLTAGFDLVFPPTENEKLIRAVDDRTMRKLYQPDVYNQTIFLANYSDPVVQALIVENKFYNHRRAAAHLGQLLKQWAAEQNSTTLFIPIPLGRKRQRERGHNQVTSILEQGVPREQIGKNLLKRKIDTKPQTQLKKADRQKNVQEAFVFAGQPEKLANYDQIVLVDDVVTTGSTLRAAEAVIKPHLPRSVRLVSLALAH